LAGYPKQLKILHDEAGLLHAHRKGDTRALGLEYFLLPKRYHIAGKPAIIGSSMETGSYMLAGCSGNPAFVSASHGTNRAMSHFFGQDVCVKG
jgi:tRNA-splicing ligase RtcB (3'-phosphate/5'-hydroxy nucleic acid ligase)